MEAKVALKKKLVSQSTKKAMKNTARLPRTAGLRTLSEMTTELTKAGLDPSRIQERAEMLAKVAGAKRKRQREEDGMDVDDEGEGSEGEEGDWMDVDGEEDAPAGKKAKANSGAVVAKGRQPRSNRQLAGMRDEAVSIVWCLDGVEIFMFLFCNSKHRRQSSYEILVREGATCTRRLARPTVLSRSRW